MLDKARERNLYDELVVGELCAFMASRPAAFDLIILADTLVYFGALEEAFDTAHSALTRGGILAFAVESRGDDSGPHYSWNCTAATAIAPTTSSPCWLQAAIRCRAWNPS